MNIQVSARHHLSLEFDEIRNRLAGHAQSERAKEALFSLTPCMSRAEAELRMRETSDAKRMLESFGNPPLPAMTDLEKLLKLVEIESLLLPEQLGSIGAFLLSCKRMKAYCARAEASNIASAAYGLSIEPMTDLYEELNLSIRGDQVLDEASPLLRDLRRRVLIAEEQIKTRLDAIVKSKKEFLSDFFVSVRKGRYTLPVKSSYKASVPGAVIDASQSGTTVFIEPTQIGTMQSALSLLRIDEANEERRILYSLTALVSDYLPSFRRSIEALETLDVLFAKGKLSLEQKASPVPFSDDGRLVVVDGVHPLLPRDRAVPLNFSIGGGLSGVVITGPNTGGKTVALKTVGLLSLMAQSGLHVPAGEGSRFLLRNAVLCDIGDNQSIAENLSTFSAHITNIISILSLATSESLVLLDELGSGTDPAEGMGIAIAVLDECLRLGCLFVATTHYPEIKEYAKNTPGLVNARMTFDLATLSPLYTLEIGEAGESCALEIARRLGLPPRLLDRAASAAYGAAPRAAAPPYEAPLPASGAETRSATLPSLAAPPKKKEPAPHSLRFKPGDSVVVYPSKEIGIVFRAADEQGFLGVLIKGRKQTVGHKRLKLKVAASELYPPDYDFSVVFDSVANRKARHNIERGSHEGQMIRYDE